MSKYTTEEQRRHHSLAMQGIEGYSSGTIGGNRFTISPGLFGLGVTGNVNVDVGTIQNMQAVAAGIDPNTGLSLVSGTGQGGYNEAGDWVDEYGNVMGGTMESAMPGKNDGSETKFSNVLPNGRSNMPESTGLL